MKIVEAGRVSAGLPCSWFDVEIRCRVTRQMAVPFVMLKDNTKIAAVLRLATVALNQKSSIDANIFSNAGYKAHRGANAERLSVAPPP